MKTARTIPELRAGLSELGSSIGLVPTMGFLHEGHGSLIQAAKRHSDAVVVSILNPLQLNNLRDLDTYPVSEEADLALCRSLGADLVFMPTRVEMYPEEPRLQLSMPSLTQTLCGPRRPGHFEGGTSGCCAIVSPLHSGSGVFWSEGLPAVLRDPANGKGSKLSGGSCWCETVRESDGLAMSSRNANLKPQHREQAASLSCGFKLAEKALKTDQPC